VTRLPLINARQFHKLLTFLGFELVRTRGNHRVYQHADGRRTMIPYHGGKDLPRPLLAAILRQAGLSRQDYLSLIDQL
jgi:predicted RNA binding protein YcfA (HicA-like mRNA interferase family)